MAAALARRSFLDHWITRVVALLIALALAFAIYQSWQGWQARQGAAPLPAGALGDAVTMSPALRACVEQRYAAVDDMLANGVIAAAQVAEFKARARNLCEQTVR